MSSAKNQIEESPCEDASAKKQDNANNIQKVKDELKKIPQIYIDKPGIKSFLSNLFDVDSVVRRVKKHGVGALLETVLPHKAREYIYSIDSIVSIIAPNSFASNTMNVLRNISLLDSMSDDITDKILCNDELHAHHELGSIVRSAKECPLRLSDYFIEAVCSVPMCQLLLMNLSNFPIGGTVELKSEDFRTNDSESDLLHMKLVYKTGSIESDTYGYFLHSSAYHFILVVDVIEYGIKMVMTCAMNADRNDLTLRRLSTFTTQIFLLYTDEEKYNTQTKMWCHSLPFAMVNFNQYICQLFLGSSSVGLVERPEMTAKISNEIFDKKTESIVHRIVHADQIGCSRAYALVGIPGTGKTFIMYKLMKEAAGAAILFPYLSDRGFNYEARAFLQDVVNAICNKHIFIMLDDFDKYMSDLTNAGSSTQELIYFFEYMRNKCPGGVDEDGNPRKTFTLITTMNNPTVLANSIIKRSERFDEVIEIGLPQPFVYGKRLDTIKDKEDPTVFDSWKFRLVYWYMRRKVITLADISNIYSILKTHRKEDGKNRKYGIRDLLYAIKYISRNRSSANKEYEI